MQRTWAAAVLALCLCVSARAQPEPRLEDYSTAAACEATTEVRPVPPVAEGQGSPGYSYDSRAPNRRLESCFGTYFGRQALLEHCAKLGADFNKPCPGASQRPDPSHALDFAIDRADLTAIRALLDAGADLKLAWQPMAQLAGACYDAKVPDCREIAAMLLAHGASLEESRGYGTPMTHAWAGGQRKMAYALLDMGADINALGFDGCTVLNRARADNDAKNVALLESRGAKTDAACTARKSAEKLDMTARYGVWLMMCSIFGGCSTH